MNDELKLCPFCGHQPRIKYAQKSGGIVCPAESACHGSGLCFLFLPESEKSAIAAWNTRIELGRENGE